MNDLSSAPPPGGESPVPGSRLQRERERRGLSVIEAAEKLHLDPSVVDALESNRFTDVGPAVFAKGHLKQYAALLNLPVSEIMASYEVVQRATTNSAPSAGAAVRGSSASEGASDALATPFPKMPSLQQLPLLAKLPALSLPVGIVLVTLLLGATALLWWKPWQNHAAQVALNSQGVAMSPPAPAEADSAAQTEGAVVPPDAGAVTPGAAQSATAAGTASPLAGRVRLRMSFSADSWVELHDAGGATVYRGKGAANSVKTVSGAAPLSVYLGYVSGVQLEINSHAVAIGPQFVRGDVARFEAGADGVLRRTARP